MLMIADTSDNIEYRTNVFRALFYIISLNGFILIVLFIAGEIRSFGVFSCLAVVNGYYVISTIIKPFRIFLRMNESLIEVHYFLSLLKKPRVARIADIQLSYDYEIRAKGIKLKVLRIMDGNRVIVELVANESGWSKHTLDEIFEKLRLIVPRRHQT
jgi:hypothetical protein